MVKIVSDIVHRINETIKEHVYTQIVWYDKLYILIEGVIRHLQNFDGCPRIIRNTMVKGRFLPVYHQS